MSSAQQIIDDAVRKHSEVIFGEGSCPAQQYLLDAGIQFEWIDLESQDKVSEILSVLKERNGHQTVPQVYIAGRFVGGFDDLVALPRAQLKSKAAEDEKRGCCGGHQCN